MSTRVCMANKSIIIDKGNSYKFKEQNQRRAKRMKLKI